MPTAPLQVTIYDKSFVRTGWIGDPRSLTCTPRYNQTPTAQITLPDGHKAIPKLATKGARVVIDYHGERTVTGIVDSIGSDPRGDDGAPPSVTAQIVGWFDLLGAILAWQVPDDTIDDQDAHEFDVKTGTAETVAKWYVQRAVDRAGWPITVAPDEGRGDTITLQARMTSLRDLLLPAVEQAGLGLTLEHDPATGGLVFDVYESAWYPLTITPGSGIVTDWQWSLASPAATRAVIGGQGEGTARVFREYVATATETAWGLTREVFLDAADLTDPADLIARGQQAVAEAAATHGLALTFAETETFRYGIVRVGDLLTTRLVPGAPSVVEVLREAPITWGDRGLSVTPIAGIRAGDRMTQLGRVVSALARRVRQTSTTK